MERGGRLMGFFLGRFTGGGGGGGGGWVRGGKGGGWR